MDDLRDGLDEFYKSLHKRRGSGRAGASLSGVKPVLSSALSVHPRQVKEAIEDAKAKGVPTEFAPDGRPLIRSRRHLRDYCHAYGFYNRDAGYGDAQRGSFKGSDRVSPKTDRELRSEY